MTQAVDVGDGRRRTPARSTVCSRSAASTWTSPSAEPHLFRHMFSASGAKGSQFTHPDD